MKLLFTLLSFTFLFSCSNEDAIKTTSNSTDNTDSISNQKTDNQVEKVKQDSSNQLNTNTKEKTIDFTGDYLLENFPKKWFRLDPENKGSEEYVINDWCEAEILQLIIEKDENENWVISVHYGQDSDLFKLVDFVAEEKEMELYQVVDGNFIVEKPAYDGGGIATYHLMWNKDLKFAYFDGFFSETTMMVCEQNKDNYKTIVENCDY